MAGITPWWERIEPTAERQSSQVGCSYRYRTFSECKVQIADGTPVRRCQRILQTFRECPGRPREEIERSKEETTDTNFQHSPDVLGNPEHALRDSEEGMQAGPLLEQDVGDVLEDFKRLAKELQTDAFRDLGSSIPLEPAQPAQKRHFDDASQEQQPNSILGRLFKRHRPADSQAEEMPRRHGWEEYAKDFQEV